MRTSDKRSMKGLDSFVAKSVLGHHRVKDAGWDGGGYVQTESEQISLAEYRTPRYSQSIGTAWAIVNFLERKGYWLRLLSPFHAGGEYSAGFTLMQHTLLAMHGWNGQPDFEAMADTPQLAIISAACMVITAEKRMAAR